MTLRVAFLGGGAVGAPAALLAARALKDAEVTVVDSGRRPPGSRTFVLLCGTCERLKDSGAWEAFAGSAHRIASVDGSFEGAFGGLRLSGDDCFAECVGNSFAEGGFVDAAASALRGEENVRMLAGATVESVGTDGSVTWRDGEGKSASERFDLVAVAGLPQDLLVGCGFSFSTKEYDHLALVSSFECDDPGDESRERILDDGASTLIPRADGFGHVLIASRESAERLSDLDDEAYSDLAKSSGWLPEGRDAVLAGRGSFTPRMRTARNPTAGRVVLLGASACSVHPIGAQELNLGLRDALELASMLESRGDRTPEEIAGAFGEARAADRQRIARLTDAAAMLSTMRFPGKLCLAGLAATAVDVCPPARRMLLGAAILP